MLVRCPMLGPRLMLRLVLLMLSHALPRGPRPGGLVTNPFASNYPSRPVRPGPAAPLVLPDAVDPRHGALRWARPGGGPASTRYPRQPGRRHGNGGLRWTQKGGGYYAACNRRLAGVARSSDDPFRKPYHEPARWSRGIRAPRAGRTPPHAARTLATSRLGWSDRRGSAGTGPAPGPSPSRSPPPPAIEAEIVADLAAADAADRRHPPAGPSAPGRRRMAARASARDRVRVAALSGSGPSLVGKNRRDGDWRGGPACRAAAPRRPGPRGLTVRAGRVSSPRWACSRRLRSGLAATGVRPPAPWAPPRCRCRLCSRPARRRRSDARSRAGPGSTRTSSR